MGKNYYKYYDHPKKVHESPKFSLDFKSDDVLLIGLIAFLLSCEEKDWVLIGALGFLLVAGKD